MELIVSTQARWSSVAPAVREEAMLSKYGRVPDHEQNMEVAV